MLKRVFNLKPLGSTINFNRTLSVFKVKLVLKDGAEVEQEYLASCRIKPEKQPSLLRQLSFFSCRWF